MHVVISERGDQAGFEVRRLRSGDPGQRVDRAGADGRVQVMSRRDQRGHGGSGFRPELAQLLGRLQTGGNGSSLEHADQAVDGLALADLLGAVEPEGGEGDEDHEGAQAPSEWGPAFWGGRLSHGSPGRSEGSSRGWHPTGGRTRGTGTRPSEYAGVMGGERGPGASPRCPGLVVMSDLPRNRFRHGCPVFGGRAHDGLAEGDGAEVVSARDVGLGAGLDGDQEAGHGAGEGVGEPGFGPAGAVPDAGVVEGGVVERAGHLFRPAGPADGAEGDASGALDAPPDEDLGKAALRERGRPRRRPRRRRGRGCRIRECKG